MSKSRPQLGRRVDRSTPISASAADVTENGDARADSTPDDSQPPAETPETESPPAGPGRPPGSKNREYLIGERNPGVCPNCRCTDSLSESKRTVPLPNDPDFSHVDLIKCCCKKCGQWRVDRQKCNPAE